MKTTCFSFKFFQKPLALAIVLALSGICKVSGQENITSNNLHPYINIIKDKSNEASAYARQAYNATTFNDVKIQAQQIANLVEEDQKAVANAEKIVNGIIIPANNATYERKILNVSAKITDLQNKINYAYKQLNKISKAENLEEAKLFVNDVIYELKRTEKVITELEEEFVKAEQSLTAVD